MRICDVVPGIPTSPSVCFYPMNTEAQQIDLALVKRAAARDYVRKRYALRTLVRLGVFSPEQARARMTSVVRHLTTWRAARALLKDR